MLAMFTMNSFEVTVALPLVLTEDFRLSNTGHGQTFEGKGNTPHRDAVAT